MLGPKIQNGARGKFIKTRLKPGSDYEVESISLLADESTNWIMQSCQQEHGAFYRSTGNHEEYAFYNPQLANLELWYNLASNWRIMSVYNTRRGYYLVTSCNTANPGCVLFYSNPGEFWKGDMTKPTIYLENQRWMLQGIQRINHWAGNEFGVSE